MAKLKLSYFRHIVTRKGSLKKTIMLGTIAGSRKRRPNTRWTDSVREAIGGLSRS